MQSAIKDICLTIKAEDYFDLEEPLVDNIMVELPDKLREQYDQFEKEMYAEIQGHEVEVFNAAAKSGKCSQLANGAIYIDDKQNWKEVHKAKLDALQSIVEETGGVPLLVAYWFKSDLARLKKAFPKGRALDAKQKTEDDWNAGKISMLFVHPQSAGHGLNLQHGGHHIAFFSMTWNLEFYQQVIERIGPVRQMQSGYERLVYVYRILAARTTDMIMLDRIKTKCGVQEALMNALKRGR
jgi:SNF2 family DNA or RNA helicase